MKEYSVRYAALESLPNFNEAFRFAKEFEGKVFVIEYGAQTWAETCVNYDKWMRTAENAAVSDGKVIWSVTQIAGATNRDHDVGLRNGCRNGTA